MKKLNEQNRLFVAEYIIDLNGKEAAVRAGYSPKNASQSAYQLLQRPEIQDAIAEAQAERLKRCKVNADWVLQRLVDEADADLAELFDDAGNLLNVKDWPKVFRKGLVAGIEVNELFEGYGKDRKQVGLVKKIKLADRVKVVELIGKHVDVRAFREQIGLSDPSGGPVRTTQISPEQAAQIQKELDELV